MKIVAGYPPNITSIREVCKPPPGTIFCYGDTIYAPEGIRVPGALVAHEKVHSKQQGDDPAGWWAEYLEHPPFRLGQEAPAHIAEYQWFIDQGYGRVMRRRMLHAIANRLSGPLYGRLLSLKAAKGIITGGVTDNGQS